MRTFSYTNAVDYLHTVMQLMAPVWQHTDSPEIVVDVTAAFKTLTDCPLYEGDRPRMS